MGTKNCDAVKARAGYCPAHLSNVALLYDCVREEFVTWNSSWRCRYTCTLINSQYARDHRPAYSFFIMDKVGTVPITPTVVTRSFDFISIQCLV